LADWGPFAHPQLIGFLDGGHIQTNKDPFLPGANARSLYGAGVGLNLLTRSEFTLRATWAWKIGGEPALAGPDSGSRGWVEVRQAF